MASIPDESATERLRYVADINSRLGVNLMGSDPRTWLDDCRRIEGLGLDQVSVADHLVEGSKNPLVALAAAAAVTTAA